MNRLSGIVLASGDTAIEGTDEGAFAGEGQAVADDRPQDRYQKRGGETLSHCGEHILLAHHPRIEQGKARNRHHEHKAGRADHPGGVGGVDL
jgi:hypothetical protein